MSYDSVSTIVILTIIVIIALIWLPKQTIDSMKRVLERRQDKHSSSMHIVDNRAFPHFSDGRIVVIRGENMRQVTNNLQKMTPERIREIRQLRRQAAHRRGILLLVLVVIAVILAGAAAIWHFSYAFSIIPLICTGIVLALGVRVNKSALEWERKLHIAQKQAKQAKIQGKTLRKTDIAKSVNKNTKPAVQLNTEIKTTYGNQRSEQQKRKKTDVSIAENKKTDVKSYKTSIEVASAESKNPLQDETPTVLIASTAKQQVKRDIDKQCEQQKGKTSHSSRIQSEIVQRVDIDKTAPDSVEPLHRQDLISFSLGTQTRADESDIADEVQSLEIKSQKQIAKAVPVDNNDNGDVTQKSTQSDIDLVQSDRIISETVSAKN